MAVDTIPVDLAFAVGRSLFGLVLGFMGLNHVLNVDQMSGYADMKGVPMPTVAVVATGLLLLLGGLSVTLGVYPVLGAAALVIFFIGTTPIMHDFWAVEDPEQRQSEMTDFMKNVALLGGAFVLLAIGSADWPYAVGIGL